jgi:CO dehydrogenase maturation factor
MVLAQDQWVLVDAEAGLEHFGRGVFEGADMVMLVVDPSHEAVVLAGRAQQLSKEAGRRMVVVLNKINRETEPILRKQLETRGIAADGAIRAAAGVARVNLVGDSLGPYARGQLRNDLEAVVDSLRENLNSGGEF